MMVLAALAVLPTLQSPDTLYLRGVAQHTWACIQSLEEPTTGIPYDNSDRGEFSSTSNIGIYMTSVYCAHRLGFITRADAVTKLNKTIRSVVRLQAWFGFHQTWNSVRALTPGTNDRWVSVLDSGNLYASLLLIAQAYPELALPANALLDRHDWSAFYDRDRRALYGGYNTETLKFNKDWKLDTLGTDAALAQFFCIAKGVAPISFWKGLNRRRITWEGETFLWPGWEGGGLFMQFISGMWLDLRNTELGNSAAAFARAQVRHKQTLNAPVWGWSACDNPDGGYLGWGALRDDVVTAHASALAIEVTPDATIANLRALEALGNRSPNYGFYDSYNWRTNRNSRLFLTLDQGMLLISLTNYLDNNSVRKGFGSSPLVVAGRQKLGY